MDGNYSPLDPQTYDPEDAREQAFLALKEKADAGDAEAQYQTAICYNDGVGTEQSFDQFKKYIYLSAEQGHDLAQTLIGRAFEGGGSGFPIDLEKAVYYYKMAAENDDPFSKTLLAYFYENGICVEKSLAKAIELYRSADEENTYLAAGTLGFFHEYGIGFPKSAEKARKFYLKCAEGFDDAIEFHTAEMNRIKQFNRNGIGLNHAYRNLFILFRSKAETGDCKAQCALAHAFRTGFGIEKDLNLAEKYYRLSSEQGYCIAQRWLGYFYEKGIALKQSDEKALSLYLKAAEQNDAIACALIGHLYERSLGVLKSSEEALKYYQKAKEGVWDEDGMKFGQFPYYGQTEEFFYEKVLAELGHPVHQYNLAAKYKYGPTEHSEELFIKYLKLSADQGYDEAQFNLGNIYDFIERDYTKASHYYQLAANQNHPTAKAYLSYLYENGLGLPQDIEKAVSLYKQSAEQNDPNGLRALSYCYEQGKEFVKSLTEASRLLELSFHVEDVREGSVRSTKLLRVKHIVYAAPNDPKAHLYRGDFFHRGVDTKRWDKEAIYHYQEAAEKGNSDAQYILTHIFHITVSKDAVKETVKQLDPNDPEDQQEIAFLELKRKADEGSAEAQREVANCYLRGIGTTQSEENYRYYLELAVEQHDLFAGLSMAYNYEVGYGGIPKSYAKAVKLCKEHSTYSSKASAMLGYFYEYGLGITQDKEKAFSCYKIAAEDGDCFSCGKVALFMMEKASPESSTHAEDYLLKCANVNKAIFEDMSELEDLSYYNSKHYHTFEKLFLYRFAKAYFGDPEAMYKVAQHYAEGRGVEPSDVKAYEYYVKSAEAGSKMAKQRVIEMIEEGKTLKVHNDKHASSVSEEQNSNFGYPPYPENMGQFCKQGRDYFRNDKDKEAYECYVKGAAEGDSYAHYFLAESYRFGFGVKKNLIKAKAHYKVAAQAGLPQAQLEFVITHLTHGEIPDSNLFKSYLKSAAERGVLSARIWLAKSFETGAFYEISYEEAFKHYKIAADAGDYEAEYELAKLYAFGKGVAKSEENSFTYLSKSANQDNPKAHYMLGVCYEHGFGTSVDVIKAFKHYSRAAFLNHPKAFYELGRLYQNEMWANASFFIPYYYQQGAKKDDVRAQCALGHLYEVAYSLPHSNEKAFELYSKAGKKGYPDALYEMGRCYKNGIGTQVSLGNSLLNFYYTAILGDEKISAKAIAEIEEISDTIFENKDEFKGPGFTIVEKEEEKFSNFIKNYQQRVVEINEVKNDESQILNDNTQEYFYLEDRLLTQVDQFKKSEIKDNEDLKIEKNNNKNKHQHDRSEADFSISIEDFIKDQLHSKTQTFEKPENSPPRTILQPEFYKNYLWYFPYQEQEVFTIPIQDDISSANRHGIEYLEWKHKADSGDSVAQYKVALHYLNGVGVKVSYPKGVSYLIAASNSENIDAQSLLGIFYCVGIVVKKSIQEAVKYFKSAADQGQAVAQAYLGIFYEDGVGVNQSYSEAFRYYKMSAEQNCADGLRLLSHAYEEGIGTEKSPELAREYGLKAMKIFKEFADKGGADAMVSLAQEYWEQSDFAISRKKSLKYLCRAASKGNPRAQGLLEFFQLGNEGNQQTKYKFQNSRTTGNVLSTLIAGVFDKTSAYKQSAFLKLKKLCLQKIHKKIKAEAFFHLAECYEHGYGTSICLQKALKYYQLAAKIGSLEAQYRLGVAYTLGQLELEKDHALMFRFFKLASDNYSTGIVLDNLKRVAQYCVSLCYERGIGVAANPAQAKEYLRQAADNQVILACLKYSATLLQEDKRHLAVKYLEPLSYSKDRKVKIEARYLLGCYYEQQKNSSAASFYYQLAAEDEHPEAITRFEKLKNEQGLPAFYNSYVEEYFQLMVSGEQKDNTMYKKAFSLFQKTDCIKSQIEALHQFKLAGKFGKFDVSYEIALCLKNYKKDKTEFWDMLKCATENGHAYAQYQLGLVYTDLGTAKALKKALHYFRLASKQGLARAQEKLGKYYEQKKDKNYQINIKKALKYYNLAGMQGNAWAIFDLGSFYAFSGTLFSKKESFIHYKLAADRGLDMAQYYVGIAYQDSQGTKKSIKDAVKYFSLAADQGYSQAIASLKTLHLQGNGVPRSKYYVNLANLPKMHFKASRKKE